MIKQALLIFALLFSIHTVTHARVAIFVPLILVANWTYQQQMQNNAMLHRALAATLGKPEKDIEREYPSVTFFDATTQLIKDLATAGQKALIAMNTGNGPFDTLTSNDTSPAKEFDQE